MLRSLRFLLTIACALYLSGAHWMVLQTAAWAGMLVVRTERVGVAKAVETTFSGKDPCAFCSAISKGREEEKRQQPETPALKVFKEVQFLKMEAAVAPVPRVDGEMVWAEVCDFAPGRADAPLTPPPRRA